MTLECAFVSGEHPLSFNSRHWPDGTSPSASVCRAYISWGSILSHVVPLDGKCPAQTFCHLGESLLVSDEQQLDTKHLYRCDLEQIMWWLQLFASAFPGFLPHLLSHLSSLPTLGISWYLKESTIWNIFLFYLFYLFYLSVSLTSYFISFIFIEF